MASTDDDDDSGRRGDPRLWRIEERQRDIIARLDRMQNKVDEAMQRREAHDWRIEQTIAAVSTQVAAVADLVKRSGGSSSGSSGWLGEMPPVVKAVIFGLMMLVSALALGKVFVFPS